jgi:hypothetical protein
MGGIREGRMEITAEKIGGMKESLNVIEDPRRQWGHIPQLQDSLEINGDSITIDAAD